MARRHYSYTHYLDADRAGTFDERHYGGPVGRWLLDEEVRAYLDLAAPAPGHTILDVGTGTGKLAFPFAEAGCHVVAVDASPVMLAEGVAKCPDSPLQRSVSFAAMDGAALGLADRSFDTVLASRVLLHTADPAHFLGELCRVSRSKLVFDFAPRRFGHALFYPLFSAARRRARPATQEFKLFTLSHIAGWLRPHGFRIVKSRGHLLLPYYAHQRLGRPGLSRRLETFLRAVRIERLVGGSPVFVLAERHGGR